MLRLFEMLFHDVYKQRSRIITRLSHGKRKEAWQHKTERRYATVTIVNPFDLCALTIRAKGIKRNVVFDMAKLFVKVNTEKSEIHKIANSELEILVFYGSRDDSRLLLKISVFAKTNAFDIPDVFLKTNAQLKSYTLETGSVKA